MDRVKTLERVRNRTEPWDIVVIGGGATGAGCALDAASRGLAVLLLEQHDFGKGTSSRSTKLIHGGVRYLAQGNISLVREALKERGILLKNAPHVVHKLAFVVPCYSLWQKIFYGTGLKIYDLLSGKHTFGKSRILSRSETLERLPTIKSEGLAGGVLYYDGQFDDTRLLIDILRTANGEGAAVINYARVDSLRKNENGRVSGLSFTDAESGEEFTVAAKSVVNATGAFCDSVRSMSDVTAKPVVTFSQGIHLVLDRAFLGSEDAILLPKTSDGRVLFCIPWLGHTLVGTTDTLVRTADLEPKPLDHEIDFVLETAGRYLRQKPTRSDVLSVFAGIRPLVRSGAGKRTSALSRGHKVLIDSSGLLTVTGGKWTTYRRMAEDAVDRAVRVGGLSRHRSVTATLSIKDLCDGGDHGSDRLHADLDITKADIINAVHFEMARSLEDVLARRTRSLFLNAKVSIELAPRVAQIMAEEMGKDPQWTSEQIGLFNETAASYLGSEKN